LVLADPVTGLTTAMVIGQPAPTARIEDVVDSAELGSAERGQTVVENVG
jgi:hypothetical protein